ncbi:Heat shock protein GrpE [Moraxella catarrhalis]|nr:Heat shock protein GrpE [Moraxella catarrhalis]OAV37670.1 Heat shock protein GrpE [Moraxella catarrhalis]
MKFNRHSKLHDRTGRLEMHLIKRLAALLLHDRTGRLEIEIVFDYVDSLLHDRTGRLEIGKRQYH